MSETFFKLYLIRHGDTAWSETRRHTGSSDIPLTAQGERQARALGGRLQGVAFARTFTSPSLRARRTAELAGFAAAEPDPDLAEWDYGDYEGRTTADIRRERPGWDLFRDGAPRGEAPRGVAARAGRFIAKAREVRGDVAAFSSAHIIRMIAASWLGLAPDGARHFLSSTAGISVLGYEHNGNEPIIHLWNAVGRLPGEVPGPRRVFDPQESLVND